MKQQFKFDRETFFFCEKKKIRHELKFSKEEIILQEKF